MKFKAKDENENEAKGKLEISLKIFRRNGNGIQNDFRQTADR